MTMSTSLAALLGVNLVFRLTEWEILARDGWVRAVIYGGIGVSVWLMLGSFINVLNNALKESRRS